MRMIALFLKVLITETRWKHKTKKQINACKSTRLRVLSFFFESLASLEYRSNIMAAVWSGLIWSEVYWVTSQTYTRTHTHTTET